MAITKILARNSHLDAASGMTRAQLVVVLYRFAKLIGKA